MTNIIAAMDSGASYHIMALNDKRWAHLIDQRWYLPELGQQDFSKVDIIIATCRCNGHLITPHKDRIATFLDQGGTVIAFSNTSPENWLPNVVAKPVPTNYWWWLQKDADSGLRVGAPDHPICQAVPLADMTWHHHARFTPPKGAVSLLDHLDGSSLFYEDTVSTKGRILVAGLDPFSHHGSYFMPATTRFLDGFLPMIKRW
jgi:hypothetical protein